MTENQSLKPEEIESVKEALSKALPLIKQVESKYKTKLIVCYTHDNLNFQTAYQFHKILRKLTPIESISVMLESVGGDINASYKILKMLRCHSKQTRVIVPFYAKSAAALLALGADELVVCRSAELGSIDPQVKDPNSETFVPAHSIKEAINFIEETSDPHVKLQFADKVSPLLIGAYRESAKSTRQYLEEIFSKLEKQKEAAIHMFTEKYLSHGYPIDRTLLKEVGINTIDPDIETENVLCDLHEIYADLALSLYHKYSDQAGDLLVIQSTEGQCVIFGHDDISNKLGQISPANVQPALEEVPTPKKPASN